MKYYILENHTAGSVKLTLKHPSKLTSKVPTFSAKEGFREWCKDPTTKHIFFSTVEGVNPHDRVSGTNPAYRMHGLVADYDDEKLSGMKLDDIIKRINKKSPGGWVPTWVTRTYSGKIRAIWEFEKSCLVDNEVILEKIYDALMAQTKAKTLVLGFDNASMNPTMYWEIGSSWTKVSDPLSSQKIESLFFDCAKKTSGPRGKVTIPMDVIFDKVTEMYPGRW